MYIHNSESLVLLTPNVERVLYISGIYHFMTFCVDVYVIISYCIRVK